MGKDAETLDPRIYVACLAAYNQGQLHGVWIDVKDDVSAIHQAIDTMLALSPVRRAEEYAIHDYEGFGGVALGEYTPISKVVEIAAFVRQRGRLGALVLDYFTGDLDAAVTALGEDYVGCFEALEDFFQARTEDTVDIPKALRHYIDYEAMARDAKLNGEVFTIETAHDAVHVFWSR